MAKSTLIFIGLLLFALAAGALTYRVYSDPDRAESYKNIIQGTSPSENTDAERAPSASPERYVDSNEARSLKKKSRRASRREQLAGIKLFELVLDALNLLVGLIGIGMAVWGMRMRTAAKG